MMNDCCDPSSEDWRKEQQAKEDKLRKFPLTVNGFKLTLGEMFSSTYDMENFKNKIDLLARGAGQTPVDVGAVEDYVFGNSQEADDEE